MLVNAEPAAATDVEERLARVPAEPGVYLLKDKHRKVIYVGKAKNLRAACAPTSAAATSAQVRFLVERVADFETLVTATRRKR